LENVVTSSSYDPTGQPGEPGTGQYDTEQADPLGNTTQTGSFAESEVDYGSTEGARNYSDPADLGTGSGSTVETAKSEAGNVKDTAVGAAAGVKDVAKSEASNVAEEAKYQARNFVDQTRSQLRGQASNQQSALAEKLRGWASELGSMASKSDESGRMSDLAQEASRRVGEISHWLDTHEPADLLDEVKRFARLRPAAFLAIAAGAGVLAGRVTRGAVAANTSVDSDRESTPARAYDSGAYDYDTGAPRGMDTGAYGTRTYQDGGYTPRYGDTSVPATGEPAADDYQGMGTGSGATGTAYPNVTPVGDEAIYPPPTEGEVRR
jgi:uncharacterized protein YjbJ (UPF0337 family)